MTAKYWVKLYHEILHDRKMATLDNRLWRRVIECFLFAGEVDDDGFMPKLGDMAWVLHISEEELETDLNELVKIGILEYRDGLYFVCNFAERQKPMEKSEYMRRKRNEEQLQTYYQPVTNGNTDKIRIDKIREDIEADPQIQQLQTSFINSSGISAFSTSDAEIYEKLIKAGCTAEDVTNAVRTLQGKKYTIKGVNSIVTTAINIAKQRANPNGRTKSIDEQLKERGYVGS